MNSVIPLFQMPHKLLLIILFASLVAVLSLQGCENPVDPDEGWDHAPAVGYELEIEGEILVSYFRRQFEFDPSGTLDDYVIHDEDIYIGEDFSVGGKIVFRDNHLNHETRTTPEFTVFFLDENRQRLHIPERYVDGERNPDGEWNLDFQYFAPRSREVQLDPEDRPYEVVYDETEETWKFRLEARHHGEAGLRINLFHLDHYDMTSIPLPIKMETD